VTYGSYLAKKWGIDPKRKTPAHEYYDGKDFVPAKAPVLLGHHFSSIAGAGPINGPIQAAVFGWVPVLLWILIGGIFFGAVHDFGSLFASIRHKGQSIGAVISQSIGTRAKKLFLAFSYLTLLLVVAAFASIVAKTFAIVPDGDAAQNLTNGSAAMISALFIAVAVLFGFFVYRRNAPLWLASIIGIGAIVGIIAIGLNVQLNLSEGTWMMIIGVYIFVASIAPVWILLQPRDYLSSFLLYAMMIAAVVGIFAANPQMNLLPYYGFGGMEGNTLKYMFPALFITIACGAISGFHSLVSSGTSAKQIDNEKDAKLIGYGAMLIECALAVIALITVGYLSKSNEIAAGTPTQVLASGIATMLNSLGATEVYQTVYSLIILAVSAFALTSLDTATRLARYMFTEFFLKDGEDPKTVTGFKKVLINPYFATAITVGIGIWLGSTGYTMIWPLFGAANQLLAGLALLAVAAWLGNIGKGNKLFLVPMAFMIIATLTSLCMTFYQKLTAIIGSAEGLASAANWLQMVFSVVLMVLAIILTVEGVMTLAGKKQPKEAGATEG
jgi:carbon starvation protein